MIRPMSILSAFFILQFVLLFSFYINNDDMDVFSKETKLISMDFNKVEKIVITDRNQDEVTLTKNSQGWVLSNLHDFPAKQERTEQLIQSLREQKKSWPVAKTKVAAKKLLTATNNYEKKIEFYSARKLMKTLYVGNSPSFKKVHARLGGEEKIYGINFSSFDFPAKANDWIDRSYYNLSKNKIKSLKLRDIALEANSENKSFTLSALSKAERPIHNKINELVENILSPGYHRILGKYNYENKGEQVLSYEIETKEGKKLNYSYSRIKKDPSKEPLKRSLSEPEPEGELGGSLVLKISNIPYYFEVDRSYIKPLLALKRNFLVENLKEDKLIQGKKLSVKKQDSESSKTR